MRSRLSGTTGWLLVLLFACLFFGGKQLYKAAQFVCTAPLERTTAARHVYRQHHLLRGLRFNYFSCVFFFTVKEGLYRGDADCPQLIFAGANNEVPTGLSGESTADGATVYYYPHDPGIHSLMEFHAASRNCIHNALPWLALSACFLFGLIVSMARKPEKTSVTEHALP